MLRERQMMLTLLNLSHVFITASTGRASDDALMKSAHRATGCAMAMTTCPPTIEHACAGARHHSEGEGELDRYCDSPITLSLSLSIHVFAHSRPPPSAPLLSTVHVCRLPLTVYSAVGLPEFTGVKTNRKIRLFHLGISSKKTKSLKNRWSKNDEYNFQE